MKNRLHLITPLILFSVSSLHGTLLFYDSFDGPTGQAPAEWSAIGSSGDHSMYVESGTLSIEGLAPGQGGSWAWSNTIDNAYNRTFAETGMVAGDTIYYSFALQVNDITTLSTSGSNSAFILLQGEGVTSPANGKSSIGIRKDAEDDTKFNLTVHGGHRGPANADSIKLPDQFSLGETIYIVASFTLGATNAETISHFWINPDPASFGNLNPPEPTITDDTATTRAGINSVYIGSGTGASQFPNDWTIDELRVGTTWGSVTPIPEPSTYALIFGFGVLGIAFLRRK